MFGRYPLLIHIFVGIYYFVFFTSTEALEGESASFADLLQTYDKNKRPSFGSVEADVCDFHIVIQKIGPISESLMSMVTDMYIRQSWVDKRVSHALRPLFDSMDIPNDTQRFISLTEATAGYIWKPNIYFKDSLDEETPDEISQSQFVKVFEDGLVRSSKRVLLTTRCSLNLQFFPLDLQLCAICLESYELDDSEQFIRWMRKELLLSDQSTATFDVDSRVDLTSETAYYRDLNHNYTTLCMEIRMARKVTMYIVTMYLPSVALVILSWVSFWIDKQAVPARAGLTITTILAQITLITGTANQFPGIADLKLGDTYMIVNFFFVFGSLIEFAMVSGQEQQKMRNIPELSERTNKLEAFISDNVNGECAHGTTSSFILENTAEGCSNDGVKLGCLGCVKKEVKKRSEVDLDLRARVLFPVTFTLWNIAYFAFGFSLRKH